MPLLPPPAQPKTQPQPAAPQSSLFHILPPQPKTPQPPPLQPKRPHPPPHLNRPHPPLQPNRPQFREPQCDLNDLDPPVSLPPSCLKLFVGAVMMGGGRIYTSRSFPTRISL